MLNPFPAEMGIIQIIPVPTVPWVTRVTTEAAGYTVTPIFQASLANDYFIIYAYIYKQEYIYRHRYHNFIIICTEKNNFLKQTKLWRITPKFVWFPDIGLFVLVLSFLTSSKRCLCACPQTSLSAAVGVRQPLSLQSLVVLCPCPSHMNPLDGEGRVLPVSIRRIHWTPDYLSWAT